MFASTRTATGFLLARRCNIFPNGSLGTGRFTHRVLGSLRLALSLKLLNISKRLAVRRMRRIGNGMSFFMRGDSQSKTVAAAFFACSDVSYTGRVRL